MAEDLMDWLDRQLFPSYDWDSEPDEVHREVRKRLRARAAEGLAANEEKILRARGFALPLFRCEDGYHRPTVVE